MTASSLLRHSRQHREKAKANKVLADGKLQPYYFPLENKVFYLRPEAVSVKAAAIDPIQKPGQMLWLHLKR